MRKYYLFDCNSENLGRLAAQAAIVLQGKHKADYAPNRDTGDFAVFVNVSKMRFSGSKKKQKTYYRFSGYPGGVSSRKLERVLEISPEKVVEEAIYGMLPKNKLRAERMKRILIFKDSKHNLKNKLNQCRPK